MGSTAIYSSKKTGTMSGPTDEWQLKTGTNSIKYVIDIYHFEDKIYNDRSIYSKDFQIGRSTFRVKIYPGGSHESNENYVSIYLYNRSNWRVKVDAKISIQDTDFENHWSPVHLQPYGSSRDSTGVSDCIPHARCNRDDLLTSKGILILQVDVELLEEEVLQNRDLTQEDTIERFEALEKTVGNLRSTIQTMQTESRKQMDDLKAMIGDLSLAQQPQLSLQVECPVCMERATPPMRLKQCGQGHIICDSCYTRAEEEATAQEQEGGRSGNPNLALCPTCRQTITGRPSALERVLGLI